MLRKIFDSVYSPECVEGVFSELRRKRSEKSLRCPKRVPTRLPNCPVRPVRPRYTGQMHVRSVTRTPFQTVS